MRNRFVKINRVRQGSVTLHHRYMPVELRNGNLYALAQPDHPDGFESAADAWRVIDRIEARERVEVMRG